MSDFDLFECYLKKWTLIWKKGGWTEKNIDTRSFSGGVGGGGCIESKGWFTDHISNSQQTVSIWKKEAGQVVVTKRHQGLTSKSSCLADLYSSELSRRGGCHDQYPEACRRFTSLCDWSANQFHSRANYGQLRTMCCQTCRGRQKK